MEVLSNEPDATVRSETDLREVEENSEQKAKRLIKQMNDERNLLSELIDRVRFEGDQARFGEGDLKRANKVLFEARDFLLQKGKMDIGTGEMSGVESTYDLLERNRLEGGRIIASKEKERDEWKMGVTQFVEQAADRVENMNQALSGEEVKDLQRLAIELSIKVQQALAKEIKASDETLMMMKKVRDKLGQNLAEFEVKRVEQERKIRMFGTKLESIADYTFGGDADELSAKQEKGYRMLLSEVQDFKFNLVDKDQMPVVDEFIQLVSIYIDESAKPRGENEVVNQSAGEEQVESGKNHWWKRWQFFN
jgi:hypothetical protein